MSAKKPKPSKPRPGGGGSYRSKSRSSKAVSYRSAVTGRFVTGRYAKKHPRTTVAETRKTSGKRADGKKKS